MRGKQGFRHAWPVSLRLALCAEQGRVGRLGAVRLVRHSVRRGGIIQEGGKSVFLVGLPLALGGQRLNGEVAFRAFCNGLLFGRIKTGVFWNAVTLERVCRLVDRGRLLVRAILPVLFFFRRAWLFRLFWRAENNLQRVHTLTVTQIDTVLQISGHVGLKQPAFFLRIKQKAMLDFFNRNIGMQMEAHTEIAGFRVLQTVCSAQGLAVLAQIELAGINATALLFIPIMRHVQPVRAVLRGLRARDGWPAGNAASLVPPERGEVARFQHGMRGRPPQGFGPSALCAGAAIHNNPLAARRKFKGQQSGIGGAVIAVRRRACGIGKQQGATAGQADIAAVRLAGGNNAPA